MVINTIVTSAIFKNINNNNDDVFAGFDRGPTNPDTLTYQSFN